MPAQVRKLGKKFRVVEIDHGQAKLIRNAKGTPVDGGGHERRQDADAQARAINRTLSRAGKI